MGAYACGGLNFGSWVGGADEDSNSLFLTTYGMVNLSDKVQMGTEATMLTGEKMYGQETLTRAGVTLSPSYKVSKNLRLTADISAGMQKLDNPSAWGRSDETELLSGKFSSSFTFKTAQKRWEEIAESLNTMPGAVKNWNKWRKVSFFG